MVTQLQFLKLPDSNFVPFFSCSKEELTEAADEFSKANWTVLK